MHVPGRRQEQHGIDQESAERREGEHHAEQNRDPDRGLDERDRRRRTRRRDGRATPSGGYGRALCEPLELPAHVVRHRRV